MDSSITYIDILGWLLEQDDARLQMLFDVADSIRERQVGSAVHLRGLIEISNHCNRACHYCGIRAGNRAVQRYRMTHQEILQSARMAAGFGYGTVVLQAGEDAGFSQQAIARIIADIKRETGLAITLSLGERSMQELKAWRISGADRYLLRFETSDQELFNRIHPPHPSATKTRLEKLAELKEIGFETGSGIMVGIPGQSLESIARDICLFRELDLDMIGIGPFIPHPLTPLGQNTDVKTDPRITDNAELAMRAIALTRIVRPDANIPSTTALTTLKGDVGRISGLQRGANIVMPNMTPQKYRDLYEIYPAKAGVGTGIEESDRQVKESLDKLKRPMGTGPGKRGSFAGK